LGTFFIYDSTCEEKVPTLSADTLNGTVQILLACERNPSRNVLVNFIKFHSHCAS
jgi:hypothetical protein